MDGLSHVLILTIDREIVDTLKSVLIRIVWKKLLKIKRILLELHLLGSISYWVIWFFEMQLCIYELSDALTLKKSKLLTKKDSPKRSNQIIIPKEPRNNRTMTDKQAPLEIVQCKSNIFPMAMVSTTEARETDALKRI